MYVFVLSVQIQSHQTITSHHFFFFVFFWKKKQTLQLFLLFHFYYIFFTYFHHAALAQKKGKSKTPTPVQRPPYISPYTFNNLAASVYGPNEGDWSVYQGCNGWGLYAQAFGLDQLGMRCLEFHTFVGKGFGGPKDANWQITLIEQNTQQFGSQKLMLFEGTTPQIGSWIMDVKNIVGIDPPYPTFDQAHGEEDDVLGAEA